MTDLDDTQPHETPPGATPGATPSGATPGTPTPNVLSSSAPPPAEPAQPAGPAGTAMAPTSPPLQAAQPPAAATDWREPAWIPPREASRDRRPSLFAIVVGAIVLAVGIYYFIDRTLGITMPSINWSNLWPLLLVVVGGAIVLRAMDRNR